MTHSLTFDMAAAIPKATPARRDDLVRRFPYARLVVPDGYRALLSRDGVLVALIGPGRHRWFDPARRLTADLLPVARQSADVDLVARLARIDPGLAEANFRLVETGPGEIALVRLDGGPARLVGPNQRLAFWTAETRVEVEIVDTATAPRLSPAHLAVIDAPTLSGFVFGARVVDARVERHEVGLLMVDGVLIERLAAGRHAFWAVERDVRVVKFDLRPQPLEVTAQEILTKDRVGVRVTLTAFHRVVDPEVAALAAADLAGTLYRMVQFAIREAVAARTLDEIVGARDQLDAQVRAFVAPRAEAMGLALGEIGVKDVILPGDVRELINKVVEAERLAKANVIRRQEETAATRSLLNTAKLMEDNPLLLRLKELEALERLVEKVGRIDLHAGDGQGLDALTTRLFSLKAEVER